MQQEKSSKTVQEPLQTALIEPVSLSNGLTCSAANTLLRSLLRNDKTDLEGLVLSEERTDFSVRHGVLKLFGRSFHWYGLLWGILD